MSTIILNVVIILGIIIAGGFLIFFVGDLLLSIIDPKADERKIKEKRKKDVADFNARIEKFSEKDKEEIKKNKDVAEILALAKEDEEEDLSEKSKQTSKNLRQKEIIDSAIVSAFEADQEIVEENVEESASNEEFEEDFDNEQEVKLQEARLALEKRKEEILRRLQEEKDELKEEEEDLADEEGVSEDENNEKAIEELLKSNDVSDLETQIQSAENEEEIRSTENEESLLIEEERKALAKEKLRYEELIRELEEQKRKILATPVSLPKEEKPLLEKEEYIKKLEEKEKDLAENEKEFRACKKEYKPLEKVLKTLERDEKKLRIKEAQVAKQKVVLYGVNNYADIDEEKAKKLSEELDLLDGLKLSVQHCREVIESNKERIPVLKKMYQMLEKQNSKIKAEIEELKNTIAKFDEE